MGRAALSLIERAERRGALTPGMTVVEYTGGSTGISLAFVCAVKGYRWVMSCSGRWTGRSTRSVPPSARRGC
jgi:cysteine synthase A